jgi:hypothetical protein
MYYGVLKDAFEYMAALSLCDLRTLQKRMPTKLLRYEAVYIVDFIEKAWLCMTANACNLNPLDAATIDKKCTLKEDELGLLMHTWWFAIAAYILQQPEYENDSLQSIFTAEKENILNLCKELPIYPETRFLMKDNGIYITYSATVATANNNAISYDKHLKYKEKNMEYEFKWTYKSRPNMKLYIQKL